MFLVDFNNHTGTRVTYKVNAAQNFLQFTTSSGEKKKLMGLGKND